VRYDPSADRSTVLVSIYMPPPGELTSRNVKLLEVCAGKKGRTRKLALAKRHFLHCLRRCLCLRHGFWCWSRRWRLIVVSVRP
jgi:hypothetical protein